MRRSCSSDQRHRCACIMSQTQAIASIIQAHLGQAIMSPTGRDTFTLCNRGRPVKAGPFCRLPLLLDQLSGVNTVLVKLREQQKPSVACLQLERAKQRLLDQWAVALCALRLMQGDSTSKLCWSVARQPERKRKSYSHDGGATNKLPHTGLQIARHLALGNPTLLPVMLLAGCLPVFLICYSL